jgi:hypothetical protein
MKQTILGIFSILLASSLTAQVEIQVDGAGPDVSGTIVEIDVTTTTSLPIETHLYVTNNTGSDQQWQITRVRENVPATWTDDLCWPPYCFPTNGASYITPNTAGNPAPIVVNGTNMTDQSILAELKPQVNPDLTVAATATYKYYLTDVTTGGFIDSVTLQYNFPLSVDEVTPQLTLSVAPNPANGFVKIKTNGVEGATLKMVDVLGNVVLKETVMGSSKTINTSSFRNGVYFVRVEADNQRTINRKLIIRHN